MDDRGPEKGISYRRAQPEDLRRGPAILPYRQTERSLYVATYRSVKAVIIPTPDEIRIPDITAKQRGDFQRFMDRLVEELQRDHIRFTNVTPRGTAPALARAGGFEEARDIRDALHGFEEVREEWQGEPALCLLGQWEPGREDST